MRLNEVFSSIDGEGIRAGQLATFVRLAGCNLFCSYCDTQYALHKDQGEEATVKNVVDMVEGFGNRNVTITGGEPLIENDVLPLVKTLSSDGYSVNIETNGSVDVEPYLLDNVIITADYKTESSGMGRHMFMPNYSKLRTGDVLKIVMAEEDKDEVLQFLKTVKTDAWIYLSPVFGKIQPKEIVEFMKVCKNSGVDVSKMRVQLQLHKYIWNPQERGV